MTPSTLYHVTDRAKLSRIMHEGLRPTNPGGFDRDYVWAFDDVDTARRAGRRWAWSYRGDPVVIAVSGAGIPWERDPCTCGNSDYDRDQHAWRYPGRIVPERLKEMR